jgi:hypothetical protein
LLIKCPLEPFEVFAEHIFPAEFAPSPKVVNLRPRLKPILLIDPINLLFLAPHDIPIIPISLFPFAIDESPVNAVSESGFEFDVLPQ